MGGMYSVCDGGRNVQILYYVPTGTMNRKFSTVNRGVKVQGVSNRIQVLCFPLSKGHDPSKHDIVTTTSY